MSPAKKKSTKKKSAAPARKKTPAKKKAAAPKKAPSKKSAPKKAAARKKAAKQAPFNGLLDWVRSNVGESDATMIEQACGDTTDGLRAQLNKAMDALRAVEAFKASGGATAL